MYVMFEIYSKVRCVIRLAVSGKWSVSIVCRFVLQRFVYFSGICDGVWFRRVFRRKLYLK